MFGFDLFFVFVFGVCCGSFLNVIIYRFPKNISIVKGHSYCPKCKESIKYRDLLPLISYIILRGKCRNCNNKISLRYPLIELVTGFFSLFCVYKFGFTINAFVVFLFLCLLILIFFIDLDTMTIPDEFIMFLCAIAIIFLFVFSNVNLVSRIIGFFSISLPMLIINYIVKDSFGSGDIKLIAVCGFILGWQNILLAFFISLLTACSVSIYLLLSKKKTIKSHIPFGPHLCIGIFIALFYGSQIIKWYLSLFMIY